MCDTLYVSDLDGTLLDRSDRVPEFTARTVNSLVKRGLRFTYATARSFTSAQKVSAGLTKDLPVIVYNGAFIIDGATGEKLLETGFSREEMDAVRRLSGELALSPLVYAFVDGAERVSWRTDQETEGLSYYIGNRRGDRRLRPTAEGAELFRGDAFYYTFIGTREALEPLYGRMKDCSWASMTFQQELYRTEYWLELMPRTATKAHAAARLKELLGCKKLVVFGDAVNDLPLFQAADERYAVSNAVPELKAAATAVLGSNQEEGVARWLLGHAELSKGFRLRPYESGDLEELIALFYETVHTVNRRDYSREETDAWVPSPDSVDRDAWNASLSAHFTLVAETPEGGLIGFADLDGSYFDRLYVHRDFQGAGVASALADALEVHAWESGEHTIEVHASLTAQPFFERRGYREERKQQVLRNGVRLTNAVMKKKGPQSGGAVSEA